MRLDSISKKPALLILTAMVLSLFMNTPAAAHDPKLHAETKKTAGEMTITGEVIEPGCFLIHGARGAEHKACAEMCAKGGTTLTVLDEKTNILYIPISPEHGKNPNEKLLPFAGERVTVKGVAMNKYGYHAIAIKSVTRAEDEK
ncbi:MAG: hypothetical protein LAO21_12940 [Acidobacteriia bacterium]|nr:hypothetical protein [Terriglobia bacterium]